MNTAQIGVSEERSLCQRVIEAIADAEETDPMDLSPPLYEIIDPDAMETLFAGNRALGKVIFSYNSYEVSVFPDGYVSVEDHST